MTDKEFSEISRFTLAMAEQPELSTAAHSGLGETFDPFGESYLASPYEFFREVRSVTPVFFSTELNYWVVTRCRDIEQIFENPMRLFASNALSALKQPCVAAAQILTNVGFRPQPTLTNVESAGTLACGGSLMSRSSRAESRRWNPSSVI